MRELLCCWCVVVLVGADSAACRPAAPLAATRPAQQPTTYRVEGRRIEVVVHEDQLGVLLHETATEAELLPLLDQRLPGHRHERPDAGGEGVLADLHRVDPAGDPDPDGLIDLARSLPGPDVVERAGLLLTPVGSDQPLLLTHEIIVQLDEEATDEEVAAVLERHDVRLLERSDHVPGLLLVETLPEDDDHTLEVCRDLHREPLVDYCEPNLVHHVVYHSVSPQGQSDPLLAAQWHLDNLGTDGGVYDADIDAPKAWAITRGSADVVIAVLEDGFDAAHPDLAPNLWSAPGHPAQHGWDFEDDDGTVLGDAKDRGATAHGTAVAGCAAAKGDNGIGGSGSCPDCSLMLIRRKHPKDYFADAEAIHWAWKNGADVINNSWGYDDGHPIPETMRRALRDAREKGRGGLGCLVLFGVPNDGGVDIDFDEDVSSLEGVMAVGSVANTDERTRVCAWGESLDVLGPSRLSRTPSVTEGTLNVVTTDWRGSADGYNHDPALAVDMDAHSTPCGELAGTTDYTRCFGGTSAAAPIVAGVAGLVLSAAPELMAQELQFLLQDTADRVQDSVGRYSPTGGWSRTHQHGYGRVNAFEAVRVAAPRAEGGLGGVDLFLRDNHLDWGNTEQPSWYVFEPERGTIGIWQSPDVAVDAPLFDAPATSEELDALPLEVPLAGKTNRVYVRVRNRGPRTAHDVEVSLWWTECATALPALDAAGADGWRPLGTRTVPSVPYSGSTLAGGKRDRARIVTFDFVAPPSSGADAVGGYTFLAVVHSASDPFDLDPSLDLAELVAKRNNATLLSVRPASPVDGDVVLLRNPFDQTIRTRLTVTGIAGNPGSVAPLDPLPEFQVGEALTLDANASVRLRVATIGADVQQWWVQEERERLLGGVLFESPSE